MSFCKIQCVTWTLKLYYCFSTFYGYSYGEELFSENYVWYYLTCGKDVTFESWKLKGKLNVESWKPCYIFGSLVKSELFGENYV